MGSCPKELGPLCSLLTSQGQKEVAWEVAAEPGWAFVGLCVGVSELGGQHLSLGSTLSGLGQIPCPLSETLLPMSGSEGLGYPCWGAQLPVGGVSDCWELSSLVIWCSFPHLFLEMRVFLCKLPQVWGTRISMGQTFSCFLALCPAAINLALKEQAPFSTIQL